MWAMWNLVLVRLEIVFVWVQDRCTVSAKRSIGLETFGMHPMEILRDVDRVESRFSMFGDSVCMGAR